MMTSTPHKREGKHKKAKKVEKKTGKKPEKPVELEDLQRYIVSTQVTIGEQVYYAGDTVDLTPTQAQTFVDRGVIRPSETL